MWLRHWARPKALRFLSRRTIAPECRPSTSRRTRRWPCQPGGVADLADLPFRPTWHEIIPGPDVPTWMGDYSNILGAMLRKLLGGEAFSIVQRARGPLMGWSARVLLPRQR
jgi:hypothetical protein